MTDLDCLRSKIDWSQWCLCKYDPVQQTIWAGRVPTDREYSRGVQYWMKPTPPDLPSPLNVPLFATEADALLWVINGGQPEAGEQSE